MDVPANNTHLCVCAQREQNTPHTQLSSHWRRLLLAFFAVPSSSDKKLAPFVGSLRQVSLNTLCSEQLGEAPCFHLWMLVPVINQSIVLEWKDSLTSCKFISELL